MIIKKLYRTVKCKGWNSEKMKIITKDYSGVFLLGFIPIYLKLLDERIEYLGQAEFRVDVYEKYGELVW